VAQRTCRKAAGAAGGVEEKLAGLGVDAVHHEGGDGARGVILAGVPGALQIVEHLFVDVAEVLALGQVVEIHAVDLVDHLAYELAGLHVVISILEDVPHHAAAVGELAGDGELLELREELGVDEGEQLFAGNAFGVGGPGAPAEILGDGRAVTILHHFQLLILVVDDFQEEHPAELGDALGVAIDANILAHDVLNGFDSVADRHGVGAMLFIVTPPISTQVEARSHECERCTHECVRHNLGGFRVKSGLQFMDGALEIGAGAEVANELERRTHGIER